MRFLSSLILSLTSFRGSIPIKQNTTIYLKGINLSIKLQRKSKNLQKNKLNIIQFNCQGMWLWRWCLGIVKDLWVLRWYSHPVTHDLRLRNQEERKVMRCQGEAFIVRNSIWIWKEFARINRSFWYVVTMVFYSPLIHTSSTFKSAAGRRFLQERKGKERKGLQTNEQWFIYSPKHFSYIFLCSFSVY